MLAAKRMQWFSRSAAPLGTKSALESAQEVPFSASLVALGLLLAMLAAVARSVEAASLVKPSISLAGIMLGAACIAFALARVRIHGLPLLIASLMVGTLIVFWRTGTVVGEGSFADQFKEVVHRTGDWFHVAASGGISTDIVPFGLYLACLAWLIGFFSAWFLFRLRWPWGTFIITGAALTMNLSYLPSSFLKFLLWYLAMAMVLLAWWNGIRRIQASTGRQNRRAFRSARVPFLVYAALGTGLVLLIAWQIPLTETTAPGFARTWNTARSPWGRVETNFSRVFAAVPDVKGRSSTALTSSLPIRGPLPTNVSDRLLIVESETPWYWKGRTFDTYIGRGWKSSEVQTIPLDAITTAGGGPSAPDRTRRVINQTVEVVASTDHLFLAGQLMESSVKASLEVPQSAIFTIALNNPSSDALLPPDLKAFATQLRTLSKTISGRAFESEVKSRLPNDIVLLGMNGDTLEVISVQSGASEAVSVRSSGRLTKGQKYKIVSTISAASPNQLRRALPLYPPEIRATYLQLPDSLPERVRELARQLTRGVPTAYDKAVVIESYLRTLTYDTSVSTTPSNVDSVDHFLFTHKIGHSDHFASAMVVMLRSIGVPARLVAGYATGSRHEDTNFYTVTERDVHRWPEAYFPGYGWVEFEPSPNRPLLQRSTQDTGLEEFEELAGAGMGLEEFFDELALLAELGGGVVPPSGAAGGLSLPWAKILKLIVYSVGSLLAVFVIVLVYWWFRGLWRAPLEGRLYERMCRLAGAAGIRPYAWETPNEFAYRLALALPRRDQEIKAISNAYVHSRYAHLRPSAEQVRRLHRAWTRVRGGLARRLLRI